MLTGYYDGPLVLVSICVAVLASYTALSLAGRVTHSPGPAARWWIAGGAFAMGTGIWSMHFVGMLAFRLPIPLGYDFGITLLSWAIPVAVSALALWRVSQPRLRARQLATSALLMGLGINAMHYVGMAALRMQPGIRWDPWLVAASIAIAIASAGASLWIAYRLRDTDSPNILLYRGGAAVVMGFAIVGMHYTGMAAAGFPEGSICRAATGNFTLTQLAVLVIVATVSVLAIALLTSVYDARLEARSQVLALSQRTASERQQLLERERSARQEAERLSALKDEFLATLSHELRTPLNAILGWVQLLHHKKDEAALAKGLETIERNARLQAQLIDDLLDMSRIVSGHVRLEMELLDPATIVEAAVEAARPAAFAKQVEIRTAFARDARVRADAGRLQQVAWNLLTNAVKFTPAGGHVDVSVSVEDGQAVIRVQDTGAGIAADFLPHVFERFRQADASTTRRHGGLGLGLAIVQQLVHLHAGEVIASSDGPGRGATFTVRLPLATSLDGAMAPSRSRPGAAPPAFRPADLRGLRVLAVDDEADARHLLEQMLQACGATVLLAPDAASALEVLRREPVDLLVSDIGMPQVDGFELMRRIRALPDADLARLPALALTAFTRGEDRQKALQAGFDDYLPKPVDASALAARLADMARVVARTP
jgi:NO-binding membrane sensor protein with MHYT domain/CheY-like chemotaxis protein/two-component sensor histidine kinase